MALDKICTVAIMTSDKCGHNRHDGDGVCDDGGGVCGAERRVERERGEDAHAISKCDRSAVGLEPLFV